MEKNMESFKKSVSKRFEKQEENFENIVDKVKNFEVTQRENKKRLSRLEDQRNTVENEGIELQQVKNLNFLLPSLFSICINFKIIFMYQLKSESEKMLEIRDIQEKLETLCSRVDNLENLSSRYNNNNGELQVVTTEQLNGVGNRQEPQVHIILLKYLFV